MFHKFKFLAVSKKLPFDLIRLRCQNVFRFSSDCFDHLLFVCAICVFILAAPWCILLKAFISVWEFQEKFPAKIVDGRTSR